MGHPIKRRGLGKGNSLHPCNAVRRLAFRVNMAVAGRVGDMEFALADRASDHSSPVLALLIFPNGVYGNECHHHFLHRLLVGVEFGLNFCLRWEL